MIVLGMKMSGHDTGAALIKDEGDKTKVFAISEERLSREKHTAKFPILAMQEALKTMNVQFEDIDLIVSNHRRGVYSISEYFNFMSLNEHRIYDSVVGKKIDWTRKKVIFANHHDIHASSAYFASPFAEAAVMVIDEAGNSGETQSIYCGKGNNLILIERSFKPGIGRIYQMVTENILGMKGIGTAGKTMGLSAYGKIENEKSVISPYISGKQDGINILYQNMGDYKDNFKLTFPYKVFEDGADMRDPYFISVAYDVQKEVEKQIVYLANRAYEKFPSDNLCIAGGVGLNCVANELIAKNTPFKNVWIQPASDDSGLPLGAALWGYYSYYHSEKKFVMSTAFLGNDYENNEIEKLLNKLGVNYKSASYSEIASKIADGKVIGWVDGKAEFGPRALGHRSILADPRNKGIKDYINSNIKHREWFRPYAPIVMYDDVNQYFDIDHESKFMLFAAEVKQEMKDVIPGVTHVDGTARVQTLKQEDNEHLYQLILEFKKKTGVSVLLNTSFNNNAEPIVNSPLDAIICASKIKLDGLYLQGYYISKDDLVTVDWTTEEENRKKEILAKKEEAKHKYGKQC